MLLLALTTQSYVTQTHIHHMPQALGAAHVQVEKAPTPDNKAPAENTLADCPFCQAVFHAGTFLTPAALPVLGSAIWVESLLPPVAVRAVTRHVTHSWRSRAPPRA